MRRYLPALALVVIAGAIVGCARREAYVGAMERALRGHSVTSAHDIKFQSGGMREWIEEIFFRADSKEIEQALSAAIFVETDFSPDTPILKNSALGQFTGGMDLSRSRVFQRQPRPSDVKGYCYAVCGEDLSWIFIVNADVGES